MNLLAPGERRKDLPTITIGPRLRRELSERLLDLAFALERETCMCERESLQDSFAAIADLLAAGRDRGIE